MRSLLPLALAGLMRVSGVLAADEPPSCGLDNKCPEDKPCCSREFLRSLSRSRSGASPR